MIWWSWMEIWKREPRSHFSVTVPTFARKDCSELVHSTARVSFLRPEVLSVLWIQKLEWRENKHSQLDTLLYEYLRVADVPMLSGALYRYCYSLGPKPSVVRFYSKTPDAYRRTSSVIYSKSTLYKSWEEETDHQQWVGPFVTEEGNLSWRELRTQEGGAST